MLIKIPSSSDPLPSEITSESAYLSRRDFMKGAAIATAAAAFPGQMLAAADPFLNIQKTRYGLSEKLTPFKDVTSYNNFYEFGADKGDPEKYAHEMTTDPWSVTVEGHAEKTGKFNLEDILKAHTYQERIYRFRCVEAWSMVVPWVGIPLADILKPFAPTSKAKYVYFETLYRPEEMRGQRSSFSSIEWPYIEGLRIDEAMHPLSFMALGVYGKALPKQNGAPLRLIVPWKYGFKSIKSIVKIRFLENPVATSWQLTAPQEYGFYSNVNPEVDHPRWSQKMERRLPNSFFNPNRIRTQKFNGYDEVASLYSGLDLSKNY